jgi:hypothetical protein
LSPHLALVEFVEQRDVAVEVAVELRQVVSEFNFLKQ